MSKMVLGVAAFAAALAAAAAPAAAADGKVGLGAGDILIRARALAVVPDEGASISVIGGDVEIKNDYIPEIDLSYFFTDNVAVEVIAGTSRHSVTATGTAAGEIDLGKVSLLPPTVLAQWHFLPRQTINPYLGAGVNYTLFYDEKPGAVNNIKYKDTWGWALQAGLDVSVGDGWFINADVKKLFINTDVSINDGAIRADVDIDPWIFGLGVGYRF